LIVCPLLDNDLIKRPGVTHPVAEPGRPDKRAKTPDQYTLLSCDSLPDARGPTIISVNMRITVPRWGVRTVSNDFRKRMGLVVRVVGR
jgi:hypothetical protein